MAAMCLTLPQNNHENRNRRRVEVDTGRERRMDTLAVLQPALRSPFAIDKNPLFLYHHHTVFEQ